MHLLYNIFILLFELCVTDDEIIGCTKIVMTPDSEFWNPYCESFALNEKAMTTYSGELSDLSRRDRHLMQDNDIDYTDPNILAASLSAFDSHLNAVASSAFVSPPVPPVYSDDDPNFFLQRLSDRAEVSKLTSSLAHLDITASDPDDIFATVSSLSSSTASGVTKDFLSKVGWCLKNMPNVPLITILNCADNKGRIFSHEIITPMIACCDIIGSKVPFSLTPYYPPSNPDPGRIHVPN